MAGLACQTDRKDPPNQGLILDTFPNEARKWQMTGPHGGWSRSTGHVEKVKLPTFSGRQEDFSEFRKQFRELCRGE